MYLSAKEFFHQSRNSSASAFGANAASPLEMMRPESPMEQQEQPPDDYYRNLAGDIVAIVRTGGANDNFYTIDNAGNVTLDGSRQRTVPFTTPGGAVVGGNPSWQALTDSERNQVFNLVDFEQDRAINTKYMRNQNGLKPSYINRLNGLGISAAPSLGGAGVASSFNQGVLGPDRNQLLEIYGTGTRMIWVTTGSPLNPSTAGGAPFPGGIPATQPLPTPAAGVSQPLAPGTRFQANQQKTVNMGNPTVVNLTDATGNLVPVDLSKGEWTSRPWVFGPINR